MKRGKDDEKMRGPMFPRLHVNDTEKGGPRAPPRNKMALYEQLSIPSQRFNAGLLPLIPNNGSLVPSASPGQSNRGQNMLYPLPMPQSAPRNLPGDPKACKADEAARAEQRQNTGDEDDFTVPIYIHSATSQFENEKCKSKQKGVSAALNSTTKPTRAKSSCGNDLGKSSLACYNSTQEMGCKRKNGFEDNIPGKSSVRSSKDLVTAETDEVNNSRTQHVRNQSVENFKRLEELNAISPKTCKDHSQAEDHGQDCGFNGPLRDIDKGISSYLTNACQSLGVDICPTDTTVLHEQPGDRVDVSVVLGDTGRGDDTSEASIVDTVSVMEISPDDVVGVIGQKHFWKARKAIVNQQRVFAVQVFELHRLIKVQKLIAESPHLLVEDASVFGKTSVESSPANKPSTECTTKCPSASPKEKGEPEKPGQHHMEYSAENAVGKTLAASMRSGNQRADCGTYTGNLPVAPKPSDVKMGPWGYPQSAGHQWLIPVMSPSEGLVYKPFPGSGFTGSVCGGLGPYTSPPFIGSIPNSAYGFPVHHHNQGIGFPTGVGPAGHSYFPSYGTPVMSFNVSSSSGPVCCGQAGQESGGDTSKLCSQGSCGSMPKEKLDPVAELKIRLSKDSELQGSTGSSPTEQTEALSLFPVASAAMTTDGCSQPCEAELPTRVIKVVPHNPRSATESAARIFRFIQEERRQHDSI